MLVLIVFVVQPKVWHDAILFIWTADLRATAWASVRAIRNLRAAVRTEVLRLDPDHRGVTIWAVRGIIRNFLSTMLTFHADSFV